jgi:hypothetical protein
MDRRSKHLSSEERGVIFAEHKRGSSQRAPPNSDADADENCELQATDPQHEGDQLRRSGKML